MSISREHAVGLAVSASMILIGLGALAARPGQNRLRGDTWLVASEAADGGDAATPADGGDAAADGGDAAADGGDATVSPLDDHNGTLACAWNWVNYTSGSLNPLVAVTGGSSCNVTEFASPNQVGAQSTTGLYYIGNRTNWLLNNNTSGGWGQAGTWAGPSTGASGMLLRAVVRMPATYATKTLVKIMGESGAAIFRILISSTPSITGSYDDGPGANSQSSVTGVNVSALYLIDVYVDAAFKATLCVNGTCGSLGSASGSSGLTPDSIGIGATEANTQIWDGYILNIQYHTGVTWWTTAVHTSECAVIFNAACAL